MSSFLRRKSRKYLNVKRDIWQEELFLGFAYAYLVIFMRVGRYAVKLRDFMIEKLDSTSLSSHNIEE
jgi:hypothetical protein